MASQHREPRRGSIIEDSIEGVAAGYRVGETVLDALGESLRRRSEASPGTEASARKRGGRSAGGGGKSKGTGAGGARRDAPPAAAVGEIADLAADLLGRLGEAAQDIADSIGDREWFPPECPTLDLDGIPGEAVTAEFRFTNTGPSVLSEVGFEATDLIGATDRIEAGQIHFRHREHEVSPRIPPGHSRRVTVEIEIPDSVPADTYRGVMAARSAPLAGRHVAEAGPGGAWALLELAVEATDPGRAITPTDQSKTE